MSERDIASLRGRSVILYGANEHEKFSFVVDAAMPTTTVLHPDDPTSRRFAASLSIGAGVTLGAPVADGILVVDARVEHWSPTVKVLTLSNPPTLRHVQRRAVYRVPVALPVRFGVERDGQMVFGRGETVDASEAGLAAIVRGLHVEAGELLSIAIDVGGRPLVAVGRVVVPGDAARQPIRVQLDQIASADTARLTSELRQAEVRRVRTAATSGRG